MGRRKSGRKTRSVPINVQEAGGSENRGAAQTGQAVNAAPEKGIAAKSAPGRKDRQRAPRRRARGGIGPAVFIPCLFLALVLGIYLGTMLPEMHAELFAAKPETPGAPPAAAEIINEAATVAAAPQPPAPPATESGLDGLIASLVAKTRANPSDAHAWIELGNRYFDMGQPKKSIEAYRRALELEPRNTDVLTDMGIMYQQLGDFEQAVGAFRKAREIDPGHENSMFNEGVVLLNNLKRPQEARAAWERLLEVNPAARAPDGKRVSDLIRQLR